MLTGGRSLTVLPKGTARSTPSGWRRPCRDRPGLTFVMSLGKGGDRATARISTADSSRFCTRHSEYEWQRLQTVLRVCCGLWHTMEGGSARVRKLFPLKV